ncbi:MULTISPECIES: beta strand repeat-containing protein [unclassified Nostoc]|uniref:beta strand repeat-containing protein n=1 Tax=unclassified Nostoc TaxID=2593658 RepID=UPI002602B4E2|nr:calcium-binding protein [Nostoc sp. S13]MDF5737469.1 calcium-binding protein [Nostoc sp. S13]
MASIIGTNGNDTLYYGDGYNETLTGGGGNDIYAAIPGNTDPLITITDFGGIGKGINPSAGVIAEVDRLKFDSDNSFNARNLVLIQNDTNVEITFLKAENSFKVILQNFALENLDNLSLSTGATVNSGNILFYGQTTIADSFDIFNANSTQSTIFNKNTVTFLNDLNNNVSGFDNSDDVINGQGGDDLIDGKSGNDLLRGGAGNNTLIGGVGNDTLDVEYSISNNILNGGSGEDYLNAGATSGNNLLSGGDGNDTLYTSYVSQNRYDYTASSGNNTLNGGDGDDYLNAESPSGNNLLSGGDGNDTLSTSGLFTYPADPNFTSSGNNTLNGGAGDDYLRAEGSSGNNLLSGGDGNDYLDISRLSIYDSSIALSSGDNTLNGGAGDDTFRAENSTGNNFLFGDDGNDSFYLNLENQTVDGGKGDDLLSVDYSDYSAATGGITTTFNPTINTGSIKADTNQVNYKDIERLNISGTEYNDQIVGSSGNDTLSTGNGGNDTIDGGEGEDLLSVNYNIYARKGITTTFNPTTNIGSIKAGTNQVSYKNIEQLNILGTSYNDNIVGNSGNDTLSTGSSGNDTIDGGEGEDLLSVNYYGSTAIVTTYNGTTNTGSISSSTNQVVNYKNIERLNISGTEYNDQIVGNSGNDTLTGNDGNDTLTGGDGNDEFVYSKGAFYNENTDTITDFGGVGKGSNPSATVIDSLDTLQFTSSAFTAQNLQLTPNSNNLEITFENENLGNRKVILQNFKLENLDNLPATSSRPAIGNILFYGQTSVTDSFDVFDANSTQTNLFNKNTVTFLNDLDNNITGFYDSNDVINGQGGNDIIDGLSGDDILRGGAGNNTLIGGAGNDTLIGGAGNDSLIGGTGNDSLIGGTGNDSLIGGTGNDRLIVDNSPGNNLLCGGNDNDSLVLSSADGNNTLNGGAGDDVFDDNSSPGDNLLSGGDGNDSFTVSVNYNDSRSYGNNTLNGGAGDDVFDAQYILGNNLFCGGDGNDSFLFSARKTSSLVTTTVDGGTGDDTLESFYYDTSLTEGITTAFNATTNIGSITVNTNRLDYKFIERLDIIGTRYDDYIVGSNGSDTLFGNDGNDTLNGGAGNDYLSANSSKGNNLVDGDTGNDSLSASGFYDDYRGQFSLSANSGNSTLNGGAGDDNLVTNYSSGNNLLSGGNGNDSLNASGSASLYSFYKVYTVSGNNTLDGGAGDDQLIVDYSSGANLLFGGDGNDSLSASNASGNNTINGGNGNDYLTGGNGNDSLIGGSGTDTFAFNSYNEGVDRLYDFNANNELIQISATGFGGGLSIGSLPTGRFTLGTSATTSEERFMYNSTTGALFFDLDGSASGFTQVQFAQLSAGLSLTNKNFVVV